MWKTEPKITRRTLWRNIVTGTPGTKAKGRKVDTLLESFELLFNDSMLSEIVTWINERTENMRNP